MTQIRFAFGGGPEHVKAAFGPHPEFPHPPSVLVSRVYLRSFRQYRATMKIREWVLDSGAFTYFKAGERMTATEYGMACLKMLQLPDPPAEIFSLDVIGDWRASLDNTHTLWKMGVPVIPVYHAGEPIEYLREIARECPKIAIGGAAGRLYGDQKLGYIESCFAEVWPKKIHGFGISVKKLLLQFPFHSVDSSTWVSGLMYGRWRSDHVYRQGKRVLDLKARERLGSGPLTMEMKGWLGLERQLAWRWRNELSKLDAAPSPTPPSAA